MQPNLVGAAGARKSANDREALAATALERFLDAKICSGRRAGGMDHLLEPDRRWDMRALSRERRIDGSRFPIGPAPDDGEIFLRDPLLLHEQTKASRGRSIFRHENQSARFAIEPVND